MFDDLDVKAPRRLRQLPGQTQAELTATRNHDAIDWPTWTSLWQVDGFQRLRHMLGRGQHENLITGLNARTAITAHKAVRLIHKAAVDGHDAHGQRGHTFAHLGNLQAHRRRSRTGANRGQRCTATRKGAHLHGFGVLNKLADVVGDGFFRADDAVYRKAIFAQHRIIGRKAGGAHARNAGGNIKHGLRNLAADQVGLIHRRTGDEQVRIFGSRLG